MNKEQALEIKAKAGAKYIFVDYRYDNRYILMYTESQKEALDKIFKMDNCLIDDAFQKVCNSDKAAEYNADEIIDVYYQLIDED